MTFEIAMAIVGGAAIGGIVSLGVLALVLRRRGEEHETRRYELWPGTSIVLVPAEVCTAWAVEVHGKVTDRGVGSPRYAAEADAMRAARDQLEMRDAQDEMAGATRRRRGLPRAKA